MDFFLETLWAGLFAVIFFGAPGAWVALFLGFRPGFSLVWLAPALGLCVYGPFSLLLAWSWGYSWPGLIAGWLLFQALAAGLYWRLRRGGEARLEADRLFPVSVGRWWFWPLAAICAALPAFNIYPMLYQDGLYVHGYIFDHMKIALVDGIAREGLPPLNPFYAPEGERIPLIYYYAWHFFGAQLKTLAGVGGWQAEIAMTWLTSLATLALLAGVAIRLSGRAWAGPAVLLLFLAGPPADLLPWVMGPRWERWLAYPDSHPLEVLWIQLSWAPQHVFAALGSVLLLFLLARALCRPEWRWRQAIIIGMVAAGGFGASVWVGGVALALVAPFLLLALLRSRLDYAAWWPPLLLALAVCALFALPVLVSITSGPSLSQGSPLGITLYESTRLFPRDSLRHLLGHALLFWLLFLPLCLGIVYFLGLFGVLTRIPRDREERIFSYLSVAAIFGYLLIAQWVKSTVFNNDLAWRSVNPPFMLLLIWSAVALAELPRHLERWRNPELLARGREMLFALAWMGIAVGLLASLRLWSFPQPYHPPGEENLAWHRDFLQQQEAWAALRRHVGPGELAQANPQTYATVVTPWPAPAGMALFGDRPVAYSEPESAKVFAHAYPEAQREAQRAAVQALFQAEPGREVLLHARDVLNIRALLLDPRDPAWPGEAIEHSGVYRLVEATAEFKIYLANRAAPDLP